MTNQIVIVHLGRPAIGGPWAAIRSEWGRPSCGANDVPGGRWAADRDEVSCGRCMATIEFHRDHRAARSPSDDGDGIGRRR